VSYSRRFITEIPKGFRTFGNLGGLRVSASESSMRAAVLLGPPERVGLRRANSPNTTRHPRVVRALAQVGVY
jgi:hypothetical protein